jgi:hypothetical protein
MTSAVGRPEIGHSIGDERASSAAGYAVMRLVLAMLLAIAAGAKLQSLHGAGWRAIEAAVELVVAVWLTAGVYPMLIRHIALVAVGVFAAVAFNEAIAGDRSCGCFGAVPVDPWVTFAIDAFCLAGLALLRPASRSFANGASAKRIVMAVGFVGLAGTLGFGLARHFDDQAFAAADGFDAHGWIGKPLPIADDIVTDKDIAVGRWTVLFSRNGCGACRDALDRLLTKPNQMPLAVIEIGSHGGSEPADLPLEIVRGHLRRPFEQLPTPVILHLENGIVVSVTTQFDSVDAASSASNSPITSTVNIEIKQLSPTDWLADLGVLAPDTVQRVTFRLTSPLHRPLRIRGVNAGCSCTSIPEPPTVIFSDHAIEVEVDYRAPHARGLFNSEILLTTDAISLPPLRLKVHVQVR